MFLFHLSLCNLTSWPPRGWINKQNPSLLEHMFLQPASCITEQWWRGFTCCPSHAEGMKWSCNLQTNLGSLGLSSLTIWTKGLPKKDLQSSFVSSQWSFIFLRTIKQGEANKWWKCQFFPTLFRTAMWIWLPPNSWMNIEKHQFNIPNSVYFMDI